jgi:hypothetical protein
MMINLNVAMADTKPVGAGPETMLKAWFLKKSFDFCDDGLGEELTPIDIVGGSVPDGFDVQSSGCVDRWLNGEQDRRDNYAFTGEQISELVVARDLSGAVAMTQAIMSVGGSDIVYCQEIPYTTQWKGHFVTELASGELPAQISEVPLAGFNPAYDKLFQCSMTVTDDMQGPQDITVTVYDTYNNIEASVPVQTWYFNPAVSISVTLSEGSSVEFEPGYAGETVYSTNKLLLENAAEGGVDIAIWIGGTDLTSPSMAAKCPFTNVLDVESAMQFKCNLDNGLYVEQMWQCVENKNLKLGCLMYSDGINGATEDEQCLGLNPLFAAHNNVLENGHEADCSFKLTYPVPCIGEFTGGNLVILMRAI